jgi:trigger factor
MKKGDEKTVDLAIPDDFSAEDYRGKTAAFTLTVKEVKEEQLPELDDEFANQVNAEEFPTLDTLRERLRKDIGDSLEEAEKARFRSAMVDKLVETATLEYPKVLVEREIDNLVSESMGNDHDAYHNYLARVGRTNAEYRESAREAAETRLRRGLVLSKLTEAESIEVTPEEVEAERERLVAPMGDEAVRFREMFSSPQGVETIHRNLMTQRTLDRIAVIASGELEEEPA